MTTGRGLDALAGQIDVLRREVEGLRGTVDADIDALASLLDDTDRGAGPAGAIPALRNDLAEIRAHLTGLAQQIATLTDGTDGQPRLPSWTEMDSAQARNAWGALVVWMQQVLLVRYPPTSEVLKDCWFRHPELVENLSWLHVAWTLAYRNPSASISTAAEWHTRWLPTVIGRAREVLKPCYIAHVDDSRVPPERYGGFGRAFADHVRADIARRPPPGVPPCTSPSSPPAADPLEATSTPTTPPPR